MPGANGKRGDDANGSLKPAGDSGLHHDQGQRHALSCRFDLLYALRVSS
jgi:hypothetical protein